MLILKAGVFTCLWEWAFFSLFKNYELSAVTGSQEKCLKFSNEQLKAIEFNKGACLVLAGPGSGKTTVLTGRVKYLIDNCHVKPSEILVITFTKAAATEMKNRFTTLCGRKLPVTFGTFHAVYFSILKYAYNYTVDNIIKDEVREQIIKDAVERSNIETEDINETINLITGEISRIKTEGIDIDAYYSTNCPQEEFKSIFRRYESELKRKRLIDFDDMLLYCRELFLQRKDILLKPGALHCQGGCGQAGKGTRVRQRLPHPRRHRRAGLHPCGGPGPRPCGGHQEAGGEARPVHLQPGHGQGVQRAGRDSRLQQGLRPGTALCDRPSPPRRHCRVLGRPLQGQAGAGLGG